MYFSMTLVSCLVTYAFVGWKMSDSDTPDFFAIICVGFGVLDIISDWQLTFELYMASRKLISKQNTIAIIL